MKRDAFTLPLALADELVIDNFAGGGGASTGIEQALGRPVDIAINHDPQALAMHAANHPRTAHYCESVWDIDPREVTRNQPVGLVWLSPDCKHFSKAKGGKPVEKKIRGLAWIALRWAAVARPRVIMLENVEEFTTWGPLAPDGRPCPQRKGEEFGKFVRALGRQGYKVEWRELRARDYDTPTIRKRLFLIARRDGLPIVWPSPTHGDPTSRAVRAGHLQPWHTAADCIDWSIPCPSIFERKRPLADATLRRIAKGVMRYVIEAEQPFIVPSDTEAANVLRASHITKFRTGAIGSGADTPMPTVTANSFIRKPGGAAPLGLVTAFLAKHYGGVVGSSLADPLSTVTSVDHHSLVASTLVKLRGTSSCAAMDEPLHTISAGGTHHAEVRAFLIKYYGTDQDPQLGEPLHTITTKDRFGLVTVAGVDYAIVDIGMRMLQPRELFRAQGFPERYIIGDDPAQGLSLTKDAQIRMCGNSVCPPLARALVAANFAHELAWKQPQEVSA